MRRRYQDTIKVLNRFAVSAKFRLFLRTSRKDRSLSKIFKTRSNNGLNELTNLHFSTISRTIRISNRCLPSSRGCRGRVNLRTKIQIKMRLSSWWCSNVGIAITSRAWTRKGSLIKNAMCASTTRLSMTTLISEDWDDTINYYNKNTYDL